MRTSLSTSYASVGQAILLLVFLPLNILVWKIVVRSNLNMTTLLFAIVLTALSGLVVFLGFKTADISIEHGVLLIRKLFWTTRVPCHQCRELGTLFPFGYFLEFENKKRVYVLFGPDQIIRQFFSSKPNAVVEQIKSRINNSTDG